MSNRTTFRFIHPVNVPGWPNSQQTLVIAEDAWTSTEDGVQITNKYGHVIVFDHNIVCITTEEEK